MAGLPAGNYTLNISAARFKVYRAENIILRAAERGRADASLEVGASSTQIIVRGENIAQVDTQTAQLSGTVTGQQITQLELNGRNFTQLISLVPASITKPVRTREPWEFTAASLTASTAGERNITTGSWTA